MPYILLNYCEPDYSHLVIVSEEEGNPLFFDSEKKAQEYAERELNFSWTIVEI